MNDVSAVISRKCGTMASNLTGATYPAVKDAALVVKRAQEAARDRVTSGGRLRNVGTRGAKLGIGFDVLRSSHVIALGQGRGPWHLIERDTKAHEIRPRKRRGFRAISTPDGPRAAVYHHPGTHGKHPFGLGWEAGQPLANRVVEAQLTTAVKRGFLS